ncbi:hypothetical protein G6F44_007478 [Rhizopus delemar]|nr:hypothetical protein G6F44_007478 [Rhizopus delemar]
MAVGLTTCLKKAGEESEQIETYLSFGATRKEAGRSIAKDAIRVALLPTINRMSVAGLITIPGAMTGQILGGAPIMSAIMYQQIITFMISATSSLSVLAVVTYCLHRLIDKRHRLRSERVHKYKANVFQDIKSLLSEIFCFVTNNDTSSYRSSKDDKQNSSHERTPLLNNNH